MILISNIQSYALNPLQPEIFIGLILNSVRKAPIDY